MKVKHEYVIEVRFNGYTDVYYDTHEKAHWWSTWKRVDRKRIYHGVSVENAETAIDKHVQAIRGNEVKFRSYKDDTGRTPVENYYW